MNDRVWTNEEMCAEDMGEYESCSQCGASVDVYGTGSSQLLEGEYTCSRCAKKWASYENIADY